MDTTSMQAGAAKPILPFGPFCRPFRSMHASAGALVFSIVLSLFAPPSRADQTVTTIGSAFVADLPSDWVSAAGSWVYFDPTACFTTPGWSCYANNPESPYGSPYFGEFGANPNMATVQLAESEAVVVIFRTPPQMRYYAFDQYLYQQPGTSTPNFSGLSDALNLMKLGTTGSAVPGASPFDTYAAVVWTADQGTFDIVQATLQGSGLPLQAVNYLPLPQLIPLPPPVPPLQMLMGHGSAYEVFAMVMRTALPASQSDLDAYMQESPYFVVRVGPSKPPAPNPAPVRGFTPDMSGVREYPPLQTMLNRLVSDIAANYSKSYSVTPERVVYSTHNGWYCLAYPDSCEGSADSYDALYPLEGRSAYIVSTLKDFVIVAGVNHQLTDKAAYMSQSIGDTRKSAGIVSVMDTSLIERSALYHAGITNPTDPRVSQYKGLYAYAFSYDCAGKQYCAQIPAPTPSNPVGLKPGAPFVLYGRYYLEPHTLVRPSSDEVVHDQALLAMELHQ